MALQYDYTAVKNADDNAPRFAWVLAAVDLGEVTKSNVDEIAFRLKSVSYTHLTLPTILLV